MENWMEAVSALDHMATDLSILARMITVFVIVYCGLNWARYRSLRMQAENKEKENKDKSGRM